MWKVTSIFDTATGATDCKATKIGAVASVDLGNYLFSQRRTLLLNGATNIRFEITPYIE